MFPMSDNLINQNHIKIEINQDSFPSPKSPQKKIISFNSPNNSTNKKDIPNNLIDQDKLNIFLNEFQSIAKTGNTLYSWEELKPYVIYYYEKNVKNFEENKKIFDGINFSDKKSNADIGFNFLEKKSSNINDNKELDLNLSNEHDNFNDYDKHINVHSNILEDLNFHLDNSENPINLQLHEQNKSLQ